MFDKLKCRIGRHDWKYVITYRWTDAKSPHYIDAHEEVCTRCGKRRLVKDYQMDFRGKHISEKHGGPKLVNKDGHELEVSDYFDEAVAVTEAVAKTKKEMAENTKKEIDYLRKELQRLSPVDVRATEKEAKEKTNAKRKKS